LKKKVQEHLIFSLIESIRTIVRILHAPKWKTISKNKKRKEILFGGVLTCVIQNVPVGLGEPVFDKLHAELEGHAFPLYGT